MAQQQKQQNAEEEIGFKEFNLLEDQVLGHGSYGTVYKAKYDDLLCAAKVIHPPLCDDNAQLQRGPQREHRHPIKRFESECEFMKAIRHPNIIQYLGIAEHPRTRLPVLLTELMDGSLTHFLENSPSPIPYHIQVNFCHDISLALSFLHSNKIVHRDLSSNNVLLLGNVRAKVTDFGMAKLFDTNAHATRMFITTCPGTKPYMPPEALKTGPDYTAKIDSFSFGVITLQILTQKYPDPGESVQPILHPFYTKAQIPVPECERRQNHIDEVERNHPLLNVVLNCLKDDANERPSSQELCRILEARKDEPQYVQSVTNQTDTSEKEGQIAQIQQPIQNTTLKNAISDEYEKEYSVTIEENRQLRQQLEDITQQIREKDQVIEELTQKKENEPLTVQQLIAAFQKQSTELQSENEAVSDQPPSVETNCKRADSESTIERKPGFKWRQVRYSKHELSRKRCTSAACNGKVYFNQQDRKVFVYNPKEDTWSQLPDCPYRSSS